MARIGDGHPLFAYFRGLVHEAVAVELREPRIDDVEHYVARLLTDFALLDSVFAIQDGTGRRLTSIQEMLAEGDVLLNADSFERERQVHKHIGDYILFWSGVNPVYLTRLKLTDGREVVCDYTRQGKASYQLVSQFDYSPYEREAETFAKLSDLFEGVAYALARVRHQLPFGRA
ncbi:MAG: hypothetical protein KIT11_06685 [Fimbriimonadaceae bacterium]|nr:hypothetical protein [Fimbriimonadaceae bacterium]QYK56039.1 MAG: hypothetical protein KF733_00875 [Fimbriimonadaceae bacterium]